MGTGLPVAVFQQLRPGRRIRLAREHVRQSGVFAIRYTPIGLQTILNLPFSA